MSRPSENQAVAATLPERAYTDAVYETLRDAIVRGKMAPGLEIRQEQLARDLNVSRTPLREALRKLEYEGLVEPGPKRLYRVTEFSIVDYEQLFIARIPLEVIAMRLTIPRLDIRDIAALEGDMAQMSLYARAENWELWNGPHRSFHRGLAMHAGTRTIETLAQLIDHSTRYWGHYMAHQQLRLSWGVDAHRAILDACIERDVDTAARLEAQHLYETAAHLIGTVDPGYPADGLRIAAAIAQAPADTPAA
jgi:DNA-binding GntR family transcriptional regulator